MTMPKTKDQDMLNRVDKMLLFVLFQMSVFIAFSQDQNPTTIPFYEEELSIDGDLSEAIWEKINPFTSFYNHFPLDTGLAENQTEVKLFHNQKMLYIGVVYHDNESRNNISSLKRDIYSDAVFLSDCFGLVLAPFDDGDNGYFFAANASGVQYDALIGNINNLNESWNAIWQCKVMKRGNDKYYEMAIPLDAINFNPQKDTWGIQFFTNDTKLNLFSTLVHSSRNYTQYDLRFTKKVKIESIPEKILRRFSVVPSIAFNYAKDNIANTESRKFIPSLDGQYNINSSLRLDLTINPDFSQVEVDQQITNLTRFAINFPERRKFFLENSDLFNNLGTFHTNPFYSRRIGADTDILFGTKLSGNLGTKTRVGLLNVQTKDDGEVKGKNYSVLVGRQNLSSTLLATMFLVNSQQSDFYNRVGGAKLNFKSTNNRWTSNLNYAQAYTKNISGDNSFINADVAYQVRKMDWSASFQRAGKNFIADTGFVPLQNNYDALTQETKREAFTRATGEYELKHFPKKSKAIDWMRIFLINSSAVFNGDNSFRENRIFFSPFAIRFKNRSYVYISFTNFIEDLKYNFDFLQNGNFISPDNYNYTFGRVGFWSSTNKKLYYTLKFEYGQFYNGMRVNPQVTVAYRLIPSAVISASYDLNEINLQELGQKTFHLVKLTTEIYFNNRLNWTTYFQYSTQQNNFNINSRFQWEYKPLSYIYLVISNNYDNELLPKNWNVSFKINRRLDF